MNLTPPPLPNSKSPLKVLSGCFLMVIGAAFFLFLVGWCAALKSSTEFEKVNHWNESAVPIPEPTKAPTPKPKSVIEIATELADSAFMCCDNIEVQTKSAKDASVKYWTIKIAEEAPRDKYDEYVSESGEWLCVTVKDSGTTSRKQILFYVSRFLENVAKHPEFSGFTGFSFTGYAKFTDKYGAQSVGIIYSIKISSETLKKIHWETFDFRNLQRIVRDEGSIAFHPQMEN